MTDLDPRWCPSVRHDLRIGNRTVDIRGRPAVIIQDGALKDSRHRGYRISPEAAQLLACLDGSTPIEDVPTRLFERSGLRLSQTAVAEVVARFRQIDLLDTPETRHKRETLAAMFAEMEARPTCDLTDAFYPKDPQKLRQMIAACFADEGSSAVEAPPRTSEGMAAGLILPHGAIQWSGQCVAHALRQLEGNRLPELYIIIGPNHIYPGPARGELILQPFETPLGRVPVDREAATYLLEQAAGTIVLDTLSHFRDHSVEMVLPFLQWIHEHSATLEGRRFSIIPLLLTGARHYAGLDEPIDHRHVWQEIALVLARFLAQWPRRVIIVASGDFTHYGPFFTSTPFHGGSDAEYFDWDYPLLKAIQMGDPEEFIAAWHRTNCCAGRPVYLTLEALKGYRWMRADYSVARGDDYGISFASFATCMKGHHAVERRESTTPPYDGKSAQREERGMNYADVKNGI